MQRETGIPGYAWLQGAAWVKREKWTSRVLLVALSILLLGACEGNDPSVNAGRLRVKLTDGSDFTIKEQMCIRDSTRHLQGVILRGIG